MNDPELTTPLTRTYLTDGAVQLLRNRIYTGEYPPGTRLPQAQLAGELGVSRTPLREAFRTLLREGLLEEYGQGVRVVSLDLGKVLKAYELREALEGLSATLAARSDDVAPLEVELRRSLDAQREAIKAGDYAAYTEENVRFHFAIWRATDNEFVLAEAHILRMTAQLFVPEAVVPHTLADEAVAAHDAIAEAVVSGMPGEAERLARGHIRHTIDALRGAADPGSSARPEGETGKHPRTGE